MLDSNVEYYNKNADSFFEGSINADMSYTRDKFMSFLPDNAVVLDAGCGSGRDSKVFLDAGGTYTITITSKNSTQTLFYVDMFFDVASGVVYAPESFTPSVGTVEKYPGSNNQYVWHIPRGNLSASVSFKAPDNRNILMNTMYIKSFNGVLKENGVVIP